MVDESKSFDDVGSEFDDNEVASATMNQRNLPWDHNSSRPNSASHQLLPRDLLDDAIGQMQLLPDHILEQATNDMDDLMYTSLGIDVDSQTPPEFVPPARRRRLEEDDESDPLPQQHREKRQRWTDLSLSPPPPPFYEDDDELRLPIDMSEEEDTKEPSSRRREYEHLSEGDLFLHPPPPEGFHLPPVGETDPQYVPAVASALTTGWTDSYFDPSYDDHSLLGSDMPLPPPHNDPPPNDPLPPLYGAAIPQEVAPFAAQVEPQPAEIPTGPTEAERREAGNNRAEQALEKWYSMLQELYQYKATHGNCRVPQKYAEQPALGVWVNKQRMEFKPYLEDPSRETTVIVSEKLRHLKNVGFEWAKPKGDQLWNEKYEELQQYHEQEGHCNVPTKYTRNPTLGRWVSTQRAQYKDFQDGKKTPMTQERIDKLNELSFVWSMMK